MVGSASPLRVGTRSSLLARAQAGIVAAALRERLQRPVELVDVVTQGDATTEPISTFGGVGVFVTALRSALLDGRVDIAVHSLKDLPTVPAVTGSEADGVVAPSDAVVLAAVPAREDPRDVLVARDGLTLAELPPGSTVGTGSLRRAAQLRALGLGLSVVPVRGNVDTRIAKVGSGQLDAVVLARAGLARIGRLDAVTEVLDPLQMLPAPGQGALAVECRASGPLADEVRTALEDQNARAAVTAERALLASLEAGCSAPVGALAEIAEGDDGPELWLRGVVLEPDGSAAVRLSATGQPHQAEQIGTRLGQDLLAEGAAGFLGVRAS
jgi:hydroxymethylbilane synthase